MSLGFWVNANLVNGKRVYENALALAWVTRYRSFDSYT
jgi:hypothetical protein